MLIDKACKTNPHIICFVGDLVEDANVFNDRHIKGIIFDFFRALTSVAPVYVVRGDHDLLTMEDEKCKSLNSDAFLKILIILAIYMCFLMNQKKLVFLMLVSLVKI